MNEQSDPFAGQPMDDATAASEAAWDRAAHGGVLSSNGAKIDAPVVGQATSGQDTLAKSNPNQDASAHEKAAQAYNAHNQSGNAGSNTITPPQSPQQQ